jgi:hypothetical protein
MDYSDYYFWECIKKQAGLKPVYGATGLGKTYGIKECIKKILAENLTQKFIYITNRHALIQELHTDLTQIGKEHNFEVAYLKSNNDILKEFLERGELLSILNNLIEKDFFNFNLFIQNDKESLKKYFETKINSISSYKKDLKNTQNFNHQNLLKEEIEKIYIQIGKNLKEQFYVFKKNNLISYQQKFMIDSDIWQLFPYIKFENDTKTNVLLGTIHKFCRGFFNGKRDFKLHDLKHKNKEEIYIIFLDEFDFLEKEILDILVEEPQLQNTLEFVRFFMEEFEDLKESEFWEKDRDFEFVKTQMQKTYDYLQEKIAKNNFDFPRLRKFIFNSQEFEKGRKQRFMLFQNNNTVLSEIFYLEQKKEGRKAFKIVKDKNQNTVNTYSFFSMLKSATEQILRVFDSVRDKGTSMENLIHQIWNTKNDNTKGEYHRYISENYTYRSIKQKKEENDFSYHSGFSLITIKKNDNIDVDLAEVEQLELITSPEAIIAQLASKNLVFALSATADIDRMVNSFNMNWFRQNENINFIEPTPADIQLIADLKEAKNKVRESQVKYLPNEPIHQKHILYDVVKELKRDNFYANNDEPKESKSQDYRVEASLRFFGCLEWILQKSENRTHLVFSNSFKREILFFDDKINEFSQDKTDLKFKDARKKQLKQIGFEVEKLKIGHKLKFQGKTTNIIFLNSEKNKELGDYLLQNSKYNEDYDNLFLDEEVEKVILVTQYKTASNGLNLRCLTTKNIETDFEGIHLLEPQFFWFDTEQETNEKGLNNKKKAFWYLWKLFKKIELGEQKFKNFLKETNLKEFNSFYVSKTQEHTLSQMALFHQALGRVDRKKVKMPAIEVTLGQGVKDIFVDFLRKPIYKDIISKREKYTATFILQLNEAVLKYARKEQIKAEIAQRQDISGENSTSKTQISNLLNEIRKINTRVYQGENATSIIQAWQEVRKCVLKQDTNAEVIFGDNKVIYLKDLIFETELLQDNHLWLSIPDFKIYPQYFKSEEEIIKWDLNNPFYYLVKNDFLKREFEALNYATSYQKQPYNTQKIFTPYIEQAILRGAIGEECIKLLLEKNNLFCENEMNLPQNLFELFDTKLKDKDVFVDFKNFSANTQNTFSIDENDFLYEEDFDSEKFVQKIQKKITQIRQETKLPNAKYIVINFVSKQEIQTKYFDINLNVVKYFSDCAITIIPSCITLENPNEISNAFKNLIQALNNI